MTFLPRTFFALGALAFLGCATSTTGGAPAGDGGTGSTQETEAFNDLVVFTTKASFAGDLGGIAGADEKCNTYATAAGLSGTFQAWLSDSSTDAISRVPEGGPWRVLDKKTGKQAAVAFANRDAWTGYPEVPLVNTEFGKELHDFSTGGTTEIPYTWTGTKLGGKKLGCHCEDWTTDKNFTSCGTSDYGGVIGSRGAGPSSEEWTNITSNPCDAKSSLLCYQVPN